MADCVERLNLLEGMGRVWGQNMFLEVRGSDLHLCDIETRVRQTFSTVLCFRGPQRVQPGSRGTSVWV